MMIGRYDFKQVEEDVLKFWKEKKIYQKAGQKNKGKKVFYFLDGPPYTSGRVHIGTAWNKSLKDAVLRYKRMTGMDVWDRAGYDMHGLPTANAVMKELGLKSKQEIKRYGTGKFIEECKRFSLKNMKLMNQDFRRMGVWMDFENAYQPITKEFMEGEWWLIKKAHENRRLYEGFRTMTWCGDCATALAKHELEYKTVTDLSIFLKFPVKGKEKEFLIIWTTTPWTIPLNLAIMVNPKMEYVRAEVEGETWIVAKALVGMFIGGVTNKKFKIKEEFKGQELEGMEYEHPFEKEMEKFAQIRKKSLKLHTVLTSEEYVDVSAGTGLVHCAPGCGPEDYEIGHRNGIPPYNPLDEAGVFPKETGKFKGRKAKKDDAKFIEDLKKTGNLIATSPVEHEYAHCWRCHKPVIYRATRQWFFKTEDLVPRMIDFNKNIRWVPEWAGAKQFENWLENLRDNSITKQRYWGTPVPIWKCPKCSEVIVVGSAKELEELSGVKLDDLHKPGIDKVEIRCGCGEMTRRIPDILDVWIDAGTVSWNCLDYPHKTENFEKMFPADFILEGKDQIRGWFNLLMVASTVSMGRPSFKNCYMHGFVQDACGRKMSKSQGNYILPQEVIDKYGADSFRYYSIGGANPGLDLNYNFDDMKIKHKNLMILWNLHKFMLELVALAETNPIKIGEKDVKKSFTVAEKYMISKLNSTVRDITRLFEDYEVSLVPDMVEELYLELSRTYIQLVREKSSIGTDQDKKTVLYVIYNTLMECLKMFAPIAPMITEKMFLNIKHEIGLKEKSIHLLDWPGYDDDKIDIVVEQQMAIASSIVQTALAAREKAQMGVRWPMKEMIIVTSDDDVKKAVDALKDIILMQTNIKSVRVIKELKEVKPRVKTDFKKIGPEFGALAPKIIAELAKESPETILKHIDKDSKYELRVDGDKVELRKEHITVERDVPEHLAEGEFRHGLVYLEKKTDPELEAEGFAREVMRRIQSLRKKAGLEKADNIALAIKVDEDLSEMLMGWKQQIAEKCGAGRIKIDTKGPAKKLASSSKEKVKGKEFEIFLEKLKGKG
ncbi:isoleucine--tRNA ligase [Candidatus Woesearchaeota archaeon]|nr:isoleucine--tRNA ligase [Candidatus Woesearchaeota archaeon]